MVAAGASGAEIFALVEPALVELLATKEGSRARQQRYRDLRRNVTREALVTLRVKSSQIKELERNVTRNVTPRARARKDSFLLSFLKEEEKKEIISSGTRGEGGVGGGNSTKQKTTKLRSALPRDYQLSIEASSYAREHGVEGHRVPLLFDAFCDHHRARGNLMADWPAAWRTWVRNEVKFSSRRPVNGFGHSPPRPGSKEDTRERTQAALAKLRSHLGTDDEGPSLRSGEPLLELLPRAQSFKP